MNPQMDFTSADSEPVELYLSCRDLKNLDFMGKSDPQIKLFYQVQDKWVPLGKTEKVKNNLNPDFKTTFTMDFIFETTQPLRFDIYDDDEGRDQLISSVLTSVGEIMGSRKQTATFDLKDRSSVKTVGQLIVRGDKLGGARNEVVWHWKGLNIMNMGGCFSEKSSPLLKILKQKSGAWLQVHETEVVKNNLNPTWAPFTINDVKLCGGDHDQIIRIECWDQRPDKKLVYIGVCDITLERLKGGQATFTLANEVKSKVSGTLQLVSFVIQPYVPKPTFIDFIRGGEQINTMVAIDFTLSNGEPKDEMSLHARHPKGHLNDYQQAIYAVCQILLNYDFDKQIPLYGFGAYLKYKTLPEGDSYCFPCNGNPQQPQVLGIEGIMEAYQHALNHVNLSSPTYFVPVLTEAIKVAKAHKENGSDTYTVLLILTDGQNDDIKKVTEMIVDAADLPLSIIIIGVGEGEFLGMNILDGDKKGLTDKNGRKAARDLVQFVPFRKFKKNMPHLAKHLLAEIPGQLVRYKELTGQVPKPALY